jgi:S-adenosylmethionine decarboxylase proenzyme
MTSQLFGQVSTGKHMICDLTNIRNMTRLESMDKMHELLEYICAKYDFTILTKSQHKFEPQGLTILYMLSESHISIHTFPEKQYLAFDIYTCRDYDDDQVYMDIYDKLVRWFLCDRGVPTIISRGVMPEIRTIDVLQPRYS